MDIKSSLPLLAAIRAGNIATTAATAPAGVARAGSAAMSGAASRLADTVPGAAFSDALSSALQGASASQNEATALQQNYQLGKAGVSLEQTMVAMQTAQVQFQAAVTVRNRLVSAYTDIMNMPV
jgi:flagellar hook-basal body complex protein FliE